LKEQIQAVNERVRKAALRCKRDPREIRLVAVSKKQAVDKVLRAIRAGVDTLGENYIQEAVHKISKLDEHSVSWHFIGHLQSNKAKAAVDLFDLIHSLDSLKLANALEKRSAAIGKIQNVLVQVNLSNEDVKSGISATHATELIRSISCLDHLAVRGLMTMPPFFDDPENARPYFSKLRQLRDHIKGQNIPNVSMDELSMGMTGDYEVAIEEGATLVRIGTAIFGKRE